MALCLLFEKLHLNATIVGAFIAGLAGSSPCARTAAYAITSVKIQFPNHAKIRFISQLINDISKFLQKFYKYFDGTTISTSFI